MFLRLQLILLKHTNVRCDELIIDVFVNIEFRKIVCYRKVDLIYGDLFLFLVKVNDISTNIAKLGGNLTLVDMTVCVKRMSIARMVRPKENWKTMFSKAHQ